MTFKVILASFPAHLPLFPWVCWLSIPRGSSLQASFNLSKHRALPVPGIFTQGINFSVLVSHKKSFMSEGSWEQRCHIRNFRIWGVNSLEGASNSSVCSAAEVELMLLHVLLSWLWCNAGVEARSRFPIKTLAFGKSAWERLGMSSVLNKQSRLLLLIKVISGAE